MDKDRKKASTFYVVLIALFSALVCVLTVFVQIPVGYGYVNFGDALIFISASMLGPIGGAIIGALGSSLADIFSGFAIYAPFTFVIKGGEGFLCGILYLYVFKRRRPILRRLFSMLISGVLVIAGYFLTDLILYGWAASLFNFVSGPIQVAVSLVIAMIVMPRIPVLFESVKQHTDNDEEEQFELEQDSKVKGGKPSGNGIEDSDAGETETANAQSEEKSSAKNDSEDNKTDLQG